MDIDVKGAREIQKTSGISCNYLFITIPSLDILKSRLEARGTETEESLAKRIGNADSEIKQAQESGIF